jgi:lipid A disaccharide synthetase
VIPELLQSRCEPVGLAAEIEKLLTDEEARHAQIEGAAAALHSIGRDDIAPSLRAADRILELMADRNAGSSQSKAALRG